MFVRNDAGDFCSVYEDRHARARMQLSSMFIGVHAATPGRTVESSLNSTLGKPG